MNTIFKQGIFVIVMSVLLFVLAQKMIVQVRYANLPKPVTAAVESRFPECRKVGVVRNERTGNYQIEIDSRSSGYLLEIDTNGEILEITPDHETMMNGSTTASLSRKTSAQGEMSVE